MNLKNKQEIKKDIDKLKKLSLMKFVSPQPFNLTKEFRFTKEERMIFDNILKSNNIEEIKQERKIGFFDKYWIEIKHFNDTIKILEDKLLLIEREEHFLSIIKQNKDFSSNFNEKLLIKSNRI